MATYIDQIIVLLFLIATLIIGLIAGKDIKDTADYSIANKTYGTPVLVLTLIATMIGGGSTAGATAQVFTDGLLYAIALGVGWFVSLLILGRFIASKFDNRFEGMLSVSDMVRYFYGEAAERFSGISGYIFCIGIFAAQLCVMGHLTANFLNISYFNAMVITATLVIAYSIAGGIRAVAITDVFQFAVLIVIVPVIANIATVEAGGLVQVFNGPAIESHLEIWNHTKLVEYTALFIYLCIPSTFIQPTLVQRYLMTTSTKQASRITYVYAMLAVALIFMVICMAFSALILFPETEPKSVIPTIIERSSS